MGCLGDIKGLAGVGGSVSTGLTAFAAVVLITAMGTHAGDADSLVIEGPAHVVDTMTLQIWGKRIRLAGIAAVTPAQGARKTAKAYLEHLVADVTVRCETSGADYRMETPGTCSVGAVDIGDSLVKAGHARRVVQQSSGRERRRSGGPLQR
jgi:endonuclease YncB( thermonuclease family)